MRGDDAVVSARERARPCGARAETLEIIEHLAGERKESANRVAPLDTERHHEQGGSFDDGEDVSGGHGSGGVVCGFAGDGQLQNVATERSNHLAGKPKGGRIAFDGEDAAFERRNADTGKTLERMHGPDKGAESTQR